ncbi:energy-coupling factor transporter transmembrane component T family protein [Marinivivus vitaminiproducens]|uniref:energy-coupling factor transporter transmembrane component T family protein n=1 Tax=Marinivivus vitaminiproducens TaxID=3035935 RepID=UPI00279BAD85|nr:energy-coupling factor transporter transmembrane component T [Geminicoccaceae bacterium SCSIO 64248]
MSVLHRLNFFIKLAAASAVMAVAWLVRDPIVSVLLMAAIVAFLVVSRVPHVMGYLKGTVILLALVFVTWSINLWLQGAGLAEAATTAARMASRLVATTGAFFFVMETTSPGAILAACSALRLPPMVTLSLSLIFGLIPMLRDEFHQIAEAQRARGMEIDAVSLAVRLRYGLARGIPLLVHALRMAHAISLSLAVYGFDRGVKRTTWRRAGVTVEATLPLTEVK